MVAPFLYKFYFIARELLIYNRKEWSVCVSKTARTDVTKIVKECGVELYEKKTKDKIDRLYERKKFFMLLFAEAIGKGCNLLDDQYITLFQKIHKKDSQDDFLNVQSFKNIDDLIEYVDKHRYNAETYFNLATTDGNGRATENLKYRYFLAWDFDKKDNPDLNSKEIMFRFKNLNLWYHAIVDSGNGYHVYLMIKKTDDLKKVDEVTKAIGAKLGADPKAMLPTQVLRVPITFNCKNDKAKQVNIIYMFDKNTVNPYDVHKLYDKYCKTKTDIETGKPDITIKYVLNKSVFPPCIASMVKGVTDGDRNFALKRIISFLKLYRYSRSESWNVVKEWNYRNSPPMSDNELEYQFNYIWEKDYNCFGCITNDAQIQAQIIQYCDKESCKSKSKDEILFVEGETIQMEYKICKKLEPQKKANVLQLKGNHLLLLSVLKNNPEGRYTNEIIERLTYKGKCCISITTLNKILNELADNGYIDKTQGNKRKSEKDFYKMNNIKCDEINKFNMSYFTVLGVIKENISAEDFKVYCYLRYRLSKGLNVIQDKLADELGVTQQAISIHIQNLLREKYLELKDIDYSGVFNANIYKINF